MMMRRLSALIATLVAGVLAASCSQEAKIADSPGPKSETNQTKAGGRVQMGGVADLDATPAPAGVKTGLPGPGAKSGG